MLTRRHFLAASAAVSSISCMSLSEAIAATPKTVLVVAQQLDNMTSLDPHESFEALGGEIIGNMYQQLVTPNRENPDEVLPQIAESWTASDDGKTFTFKIKHGLKFSSGAEVTSEDCAYSMQRAVSLNKSPAFIITQFGWNADNAKDLIVAQDADTLVLKTTAPTAIGFLLYCLSANVACVVEKKVVEANAQNGDWGNAWLQKNSAGSGPFTLKTWRPSDTIVLELNPNGLYKGNLKRITLRHIVDPSAQLLMLQKGDADIARNLTSEQLRTLEGAKDVVLVRKAIASLMLLSLNLANDNLKNPKVWEAVKWAIDYDGIQKNILSMTHEVHQSIVPKGLPGAVNDTPFHKDSAKAKALLAEAGYPDGFEIELDHYSAQPYPDIAQTIQANLGEIGIKVKLIAGENRQVLTKMRARGHQMALSSWGTDYFDPNANTDVFCINADNSDNATTKPFAWRSSFKDDKIMAMAIAARDEKDPATRIKLFEELQRYFMDNSPFPILFQGSVTAACAPDVKGVELGVLPNDNSYQGTTKA
ncbi:ABC transporter substrate-binding protein [Paenirhodobacter enshiensis]|uniref:ABC transporter substrate-binding protein n=1 Tax=Paenirhodobacter enshiensis TaxID=1105367 RepID=UPI0035ADBCBB